LAKVGVGLILLQTFGGNSAVSYYLGTIFAKASESLLTEIQTWIPRINLQYCGKGRHNIDFCVVFHRCFNLLWTYNFCSFTGRYMNLFCLFCSVYILMTVASLLQIPTSVATVLLMDLFGRRTLLMVRTHKGNDLL
jgi:hypothetical protein